MGRLLDARLRLRHRGVGLLLRRAHHRSERRERGAPIALQEMVHGFGQVALRGGDTGRLLRGTLGRERRLDRGGGVPTGCLWVPTAGCLWVPSGVVRRGGFGGGGGGGARVVSFDLVIDPGEERVHELAGLVLEEVRQLSRAVAAQHRERLVLLEQREDVLSEHRGVGVGDGRERRHDPRGQRVDHGRIAEGGWRGAHRERRPRGRILIPILILLSPCSSTSRSDLGPSASFVRAIHARPRRPRAHAARAPDRPRRQRLRWARGGRLRRPAAMPRGHPRGRPRLPRRAPRASAPPPPVRRRRLLPRPVRPGARAVRSLRPAPQLRAVVVSGGGQDFAVDRRRLAVRAVPRGQRGGAATGARMGRAPLAARGVAPAAAARRGQLREDRVPVPRRAVAHRALGPRPAGRSSRGGGRGGGGDDGFRRRGRVRGVRSAPPPRSRVARVRRRRVHPTPRPRPVRGVGRAQGRVRGPPAARGVPPRGRVSAGRR
mmetsp:Transcript_9575/g.39221  ORF Transcript_9575/g.39221 Transcript_9575/m.39221 type:complete len:488 (+) Transcript_9575:257-1720(+)